MPVYNAENYLENSIKSVLDQSYRNWELIIINDGSTDKSKLIVSSFQDSRIRYFEQPNNGVSSARNLGLANMRGDYFCFLDADDAFPVHSLRSRYNLLRRHPLLMFVDGEVKKFDQSMRQIIQTWNPNLKGNPFTDLVRLEGNSFLGLTWMIRRKHEINYRFHENITHSEDLLFLMELTKSGGNYAYTNETILYYRNTPDSAMKNLKGLEAGYRYIENQIKHWLEVNDTDLRIYQTRYKRAMALSYLRKKYFKDAFKVWL
ncbi:glycosyl transferase [Marivirga tractuosa]|nr:glycosyltransferase family 2 protein [Marivirga tractuosa]BDD13328.1 glycosyl transferase [Marivirga tractuosa]